MKHTTIDDCRIIELPRHDDPRGNLTFVEEERHIPFAIRRVFYIYDIPTGVSRGAHAHRTLQQFLVCMAGSFDVALDDGHAQRNVHLNRPWKGLYLPPLIWAAEINFDPGSVCLVMTSAAYDDADYVRDRDEYMRLKARK